uniref:Gcn5-related n-acetyltransferase-like n=1 Tax=Tetraselmis sp. GSL018 TaxID=582737 RepID=A0A061RMD9_9CHLO|mmetsp:Transcript_30384/g.72291  ORF Transcript_30384/g.72291 Transcript_30384/m.72291 type:complete len:336 (+) Transcript_30384:116-1123(+)|eukprot:CAMPEP_0177579242 /NCGR_PEP_ID=MMETSP0419_2-20121207/842_1 /TAXON_ID=582737 /ORGANISM="Tetraselmis sp., Strain GSL018" /LENGTH=335 /DNA_ID=CAMNT_0019067869 /DNA_START=56 /DNA_END=1063 /DNA_ORIENTATION=+
MNQRLQGICPHRGVHNPNRKPQKAALRKTVLDFSVNASSESKSKVVSSAKRTAIPCALCVRQVRESDVQGVADLCAEVFSTAGSPETDSAELRGVLSALETSYEQRISSDLAEQIRTALARKSEAASEGRAIRMEQRVAKLRRQLALLRGEPSPASPILSLETDRKLQALRSKRMFVTLFAADRAQPDGVLGCLTLTVKRVEAKLPPPFPTSAKERLYVCNMAVDPLARRRGIARALLERAEQIGRCWGETWLWLHVDHDNAPAIRLYESAGYVIQSIDPWWKIGKRRLLLSKELVPKDYSLKVKTDQQMKEDSVVGTNNGNGVFQWSVREGDDS